VGLILILPSALNTTERTLETTFLRQLNKQTPITNRKDRQNGFNSQFASRLALFTVAALLIVSGLSLKPMRVARAANTTVQAFNITGGTPTPLDNDYTRIKNAIVGATSSDTINLTGNFDWTEANAAASWALGNDAVASTTDDFSISVPANLNNVTITASSLGTATIQGPGDLAALDLEGVFFFNGGDNQGWTISNIRFVDFDLTIGFFVGVGGLDAFNNTKIINNYIKIATDLNPTVAPADALQNIAIHYSHGMNQMISGNTIEFNGNGLSDSGNGTLSSAVGIQSDTGHTNVYDGLQITNNVLRVFNAQSADPELIIGIWENTHAHESNITVSGNQFINLAAGNNPALNLQRAFRVTSHSSATTTVTYQNNSMGGANIGIQWLGGVNFAGNQPVQLISNNILNNATGVLIQSDGSATLSFNRIAGNTTGLRNNTSNTINAENNWWGCNFGPGLGGAGCTGTANGIICNSNAKVGKSTNGIQGACLVDFDPWLQLRLTAVPDTILVGGTSTLTADLTFNSAIADTHLLGTILDLTPVAFAGVNGTVAPANTGTTSGKANSTYTGTTAGAGSASTAVDMQTVSTPITVNEPPCTITCPANKTQSNDPNQCGAVVTYNAPTTTGGCGTVVCSPASGSFFPVGTTTITCKSNNFAGPETCTFTITVQDTQPPVITCPSNITAVSANVNDPCTSVNFTTTASDNCPGVTVVCNPPSGSCFPTGVTTVTCTATDAAGNTATCSFTVSVFNGRLQDDSAGCASTVLFNTITGAYRWCCNGSTFTGVAKVSKLGNTYSLSHNAADRRVLINLLAGATQPSGNASLQSPVGTIRCTITDRDTRNNTCACQ
jgi:hypothetical protein